MMPRMRMPMRPMGPRGMRPRGPRPVPPPGVRPVRPGAPPMRPGAPPMRPRLAPPPQPVPAPVTGNATNDPSTANKRVFVGNLNTIAISKEDVENIFSHYGIITGISMHKGYAFVQFAYEHEARVACGSEDGKTYAGQKLDCNIASEPKKNVAAPTAGIKRPAISVQATTNPVGLPVVKKMRQDLQPTIKRTLVDLTGNAATTAVQKPITPVTTAANAAAGLVKKAPRDVLICGTCKTAFQSLHSLAQHKKVPCKLRFSCKCQNTPAPDPESTDPSSLQCGTCNAEFSSAWSLVQHCQQEHKMTIFKTEGQPQGDVTTVEEVVEEVVVVQSDGDVNGQ